jgi:hypothetical protein
MTRTKAAEIANILYALENAELLMDRLNNSSVLEDCPDELAVELIDTVQDYINKMNRKLGEM